MTDFYTDRFNEFMEKYDCYDEGVEDRIIDFFKSEHPKYYYYAIELRGFQESEGDVIPSEIFSAFTEAGKEELFYEIVKNWFHSTFPEDYK